MHYLNEPFFNDLRTTQQIGYVVFSRPVVSRDILGCQFLVQSAHKSSEYMVNAINEFLTATREKVKSVSDEDFKVQVEAVNTELSEKDINLKKDCERQWSEIGLHKYNFNRQQEEIDCLQTITKQEMIDHFENVFFSKESKRLDLELTSATHTEQNNEFKESNAKHEIFCGQARQLHSLNEFKEKTSYHPDLVKVGYENTRK